ncbi:MAG TPA: hypothetical protein VJ846_04115 [Sphingomicrobium sp.]|nr:hypothetical protein [Sphingomicrobium sp.]
MSIFLEFVWWVLVEIWSFFVVEMIYRLGHNVARLILPLVSFGKLRAGPLKQSEGGFGWLGYRRSALGHLEIAPDFAAGIGLIVCCLGLAMALYSLHRF